MYVCYVCMYALEKPSQNSCHSCTFPKNFGTSSLGNLICLVIGSAPLKLLLEPGWVDDVLATECSLFKFLLNKMSLIFKISVCTSDFKVSDSSISCIMSASRSFSSSLSIYLLSRRQALLAFLASPSTRFFFLL